MDSDSTPTQRVGLLCGASPNQSHMRLFIDDSVGTVKLDVTGAATAFDTTWRPIAFTCDASHNYVSYANGAVDLSGTYASGGTFNSALRTTIGAITTSSGTGSFYGGAIAHVATWTRVLSAQEVKSLSNGLLPSHLGPTHYWPLWGVDSPEPDLVSGGVDGTLTGTTQGAGGPPVGLSLLRLAA